jgi:tungstate transport system ATP-binding protein
MKLELSGITKSYGGRVVLDIDSFTFKESGCYAVIGPNGSGKSTLLKLIAGIEAVDWGCVSYNGVASLPEKSVAFMPQKPYIFDMSVYENIVSGIRGNKDWDKTAKAVIEQAGLGSLAKSNARRISGGEAQKTAVLRTLVLNSELILLDEPATFIDISNMQLIENCIKTMRQDKSTVIFTTHNPSQALRLADEVLVLMDGKLAESGPVQKVLNSPSCARTKDFLNNWRI